MRDVNRKFGLDDDVIICHSFKEECNGKNGKILSFIKVNGHYYYDVKFDDGKFALGVLENNLKKKELKDKF